jgi:HEAT repeat protein
LTNKSLLIFVLAAAWISCSRVQLPDDRASLLKLTDSDDFETSVVAAQKLAHLYGESALLEALQTRGPTGRGWAASLLIGYPSVATREALVAAARDPSPDVRAKVAIALGGVCDISCLPTIETLIADPEESVRDVAARSKARIESQKR